MKVTKTQALATGGAAGGSAGIVDQWSWIGSLDASGDMLPALMLITYLGLIGLTWAVLDLRKRVKELGR